MDRRRPRGEKERRETQNVKKGSNAKERHMGAGGENSEAVKEGKG